MKMKTIRNDNVNAVINPSIGLLSLNENSIPHTSSDFGINFSGDDWAITLQNNNKTLLNSSICNVRKSSSTTVSLDKLNATIHYICNNGYAIHVTLRRTIPKMLNQHDTYVFRLVPAVEL